VRYTAERTRNSSIFPGVSHDNVLFRQNGDVYLLSQFNCANLLRLDGDNLTNASAWEVVESEGVFYPQKRPGRSIDTMISVDGRWYAYTKNWTYTSDSLSGNWSLYRTPTGIDDTGAYYENGTFHLLYEAGNTTGLSGSQIGHATSPTGVNNWTVHGPVWTSRGDVKTGDYDIVRHDGLYLIFADQSRGHPNYTISLFATESLSSNLTHVGTVARPFRDSEVQPERGIQDPTVIYDDERDRFVLFAHVHEERRRLHRATLDISVAERRNETSPN